MRPPLMAKRIEAKRASRIESILADFDRIAAIPSAREQLDEIVYLGWLHDDLHFGCWSVESLRKVIALLIELAPEHQRVKLAQSVHAERVLQEAYATGLPDDELMARYEAALDGKRWP